MSEHNFTATLLQWHKGVDRNLPWKETKDPYKIWMSEIILQQTRVATGIAYYNSFVTHFPTVQALASATEDEVLSIWKGLGYYSRARNLRIAAQQICLEHKGIFPNSYESILKLKGVGPYTAAAIASFAFDQKFAVLDGNVYRVLSRVFGIDTPIDSSQGKKQFQQIADSFIDSEDPATYNQAIMDFGALQCRPGLPDCSVCPMAQFCTALKSDQVDSLPVKSKKIRVKHRYFNFLIFIEDGAVLLQKRKDQDIWKGLYQFPLIESKRQLSASEILTRIVKKYSRSDSAFNLQRMGTAKQRLTHQVIHGSFYRVNGSINLLDGTLFTSDQLETIGIPKIVQDFMNENLDLRSA